MYTQESRSSGCGCGGGCDECGLVCLCRPRFFDGQLITAADFARQDDYRIGKDRLHNRYLHGTGVVCGLEVVCNPCDDTVTVRPGYALGPCGEDIVVCADTSVDVGDLVRAQRRSRKADCPPYGVNPEDCEASRQKWVLSICYDEQPSRPVGALRTRESGCGCGGSCGGSCGGGGGGGGCGGGCGGKGGGGCGGNCGGSCSPRPARPGACEPTLICEGYRFTLTKVAPAGDKESGRDRSGELPDRVLACLRSLTARISGFPDNPTPEQVVDYVDQLKAELADLLETSAVHNCLLGQRLSEVVIPDPADDQALEKALAALQVMAAILIELFRSCVCSALLPACPTACEDDCVPLAVVTVRTADLRVLDICNWSARKFALTATNLSYWLGWIPIFDTLRAALERLCCQPARNRFNLDSGLRVKAAKIDAVNDRQAATAAAAGAAAAAPAAPAAAKAPVPGDPTAMVGLGAQYVGGLSPLAGLEATVLASLGATDEQGTVLASPLELANPLLAMAMTRMALPAAEAVVPAELSRLVRVGDNQTSDGSDGKGSGDSDRIAALEDSIAALTKTVKTQATQLRTLRTKVEK